MISSYPSRVMSERLTSLVSPHSRPRHGLDNLPAFAAERPTQYRREQHQQSQRHQRSSNRPLEKYSEVSPGVDQRTPQGGLKLRAENHGQDERRRFKI